MTELRVVSAGVDSLYLSARGELWDGLLPLLAGLRAGAAEAGEPEGLLVPRGGRGLPGPAPRLAQRVAGGSVVAEPKSATSRRPIALGTGAVTALQAHAARQAADRLLAGNLWQGGASRSGYVFTTELGLPLSPSTMTRAWSQLLRRAGVGNVNFHTLRHAATTLTVAANVAPKVAARRLGHSSATITLDRYSHVTDDLDRAAAAAIETVLASAMAARAVTATNPSRGHGRVKPTLRGGLLNTNQELWCRGRDSIRRYSPMSACVHLHCAVWGLRSCLFGHER